MPTNATIQVGARNGNPNKISGSFTFAIQTPEFRNQPIPGLSNEAKVGHCFVRVTDLPERLDDFMQVNPRVPNRTDKGVLSGPVIKGILQTLREAPEDMALKNQGIYLLVDSCDFKKLSGGEGELTVKLSNDELHGLVNGGHTYAAIREAIETAEEMEVDLLKKAFVQLHILQGIQSEQVADIAEGLNRSKQVDDWSLFNLRGKFEEIQKVMRGKLGHDAIAYHQGEDGELYISDVVVILEAFNCQRFSDRKHPARLYRRSSLALKYFKADSDGEPAPADLLIPKTHELLVLSDKIKKAIPDSAKRNGFEFGRLKIGSKRAEERTGSPKHKNTALHFIGETMGHRVPTGWVLPILAAFRANVRFDLRSKRFEWIFPVDKILPGVIDDLVAICVSEHTQNNVPPEQVGTRETIYRSCYTVVDLFLSKAK